MRRRRGAAIRWLSASSLFAFAGCGSSPASPRDAEAGATPNDAPSAAEGRLPRACDGGCWRPDPDAEAFIAAFCDLSEACCVQNARHPQATPDACRTRLRKLGVTSDPALTSACLAEMQRLATTLDCVPELWKLDDPCVRAFNEPGGPQGPGDGCTVSADCAGAPGTVTLCSGTPLADVTGASLSCVRLARGKRNDNPCLGGIDALGALHGQAIYTDGTATSPLIASGAGCEARAGLYCKYEIDQRMSYCEAVSPDGAACVLPGTCASGACRGDGVCAARVPAGASCAIAAGVVCDDTSWCMNASTCVPKLAAGAACASPAACTSLGCVNGQCSSQSRAEDYALLHFCGP